MKNKNKLIDLDEARATVRRTKNGRYYDLSKYSLTNLGIKHLNVNQLMDLFSKLRLRFTLTPKCNQWCIFCSNEGLSYETRCNEEANIDLVIKLSEMILKNTPLKSIDFSGGEPLLHSDFSNGDFKLIKWTKKYPNIRFSLHTNGLNLNSDVINKLKDNFSRIGITVNSSNFKTWNKMVNLKNKFSPEVQKLKFKNLMKNLEYLAEQKIGNKIFLKSVVMRGINSGEKELGDFLRLCEKYNFHPKFLEFEPQYIDQKRFIVGRKELFSKLEKLGCEFFPSTPYHNNPDSYIPSVNFVYKDVPMGLHSMFGCGIKAVCKICYDFLCMFVKPSKDGNGLYLKPCSVLDTRIDLTHAIKTQNHKQLLDLFRISREYLMSAPGSGILGWNKDPKFEYEK